MAANALSVIKLNVKVNHLEEKFVQLNTRVSLLEVDRENHKRVPSTPKIMRDESAISKSDSPLTRLVHRIERLSLLDSAPAAATTKAENKPKRRTISGHTTVSQPKSMQKKISSRRFQCDVCKRVSCLTEAKLQEHKLNFHNFRCQVCDSNFQKATERDTHEKQHYFRDDKSSLSSDSVDSQTENRCTHETNNYNLRKKHVQFN